jgi:hypothetical protein
MACLNACAYSKDGAETASAAWETEFNRLVGLPFPAGFE